MTSQSAGITAPHCASFGCPRAGFIKSEQWGAYLCSEHAVSGPVRQPVEIHVEEPPPSSPPHPCALGQHRWAWLTNGQQACGHCGAPR